MTINRDQSSLTDEEIERRISELSQKTDIKKPLAMYLILESHLMAKVQAQGSLTRKYHKVTEGLMQ